MATRIQLRRDTSANWTSANPILAEGELGIVTDTGQYKIGNGSTAWNSLSYPSAGATNLTYTAGVSNGVVESDTGTDATIPLADGTNAGLISATEKSKLAGIEAGAEVNNISDINATDLIDGGNTTLHIHDSRYYTESEVDSALSGKANISHTHAQSEVTNLVTDLAGKQDTLVSATNIKTINTQSILGSGDITIGGSATWGSITGTLSTQTDLNTALGLKADDSSLTSHTGASNAHGTTSAIVGINDTQTLTNKTLTTPTIASFTNAGHSHTNAAGGGTLSASAIGSGTLGVNRGGTGAATHTSGNYLKGNGTSAITSVTAATLKTELSLNADDIDDASTTHKFTTAAQIDFVTWQSAVSALATNTVALNASTAMFQTVTWEAGSRTPTFAGFGSVYRSFVLEINVTGAPTITWTNVNNWLTDSGVAPVITGLDVIRVLFDSYDSGTTINGTLVGAR